MENIPAMARKDMDELKQHIEHVGEELADKIRKTKMEDIAKAHVDAGIKEVFGIDTTISREVRELRSNMNFIRDLQRISGRVGMTMILTIAAILTGGLIAVIVKGFK